MNAGLRTRRLLWSTLGGAIIGALAGTGAVRFLHPGNARGPHSLHDGLAAAAQHGFHPAMVASIVLWMAVSLYWEAAAKTASQTKTSESSPSRALHLTLISLAQLLVLFPIPGLRKRILPASPTLVAVGLGLQVISFAFAIWARQTLGRHWSGAVATKVDHELVRSGPYRVVRHPIYSAVLGAYVGAALVSGELRGLIGVGLACVAYWRKIRMEETYLCGLFGPVYDGYRNDTWALIPGVF